MKCKGLYVLVAVAMLTFVAGCGEKQREETPRNQITEAVNPEITVTPEPAETPEPTATPKPTATPVPANYMEANGIEVLGMGRHTGKGYVATGVDENGGPILEIADCDYIFTVEEEEIESETKVIHVTVERVPYVNAGGGWSCLFFSGFVDLKTGKAYSPVRGELQTILLEQGEESHIMQILAEYESPSVTRPYYTDRYTLVCPSDYEDAGFYVTGWDQSMDVYVERLECWKKLQFIRHGKSDMLVFGVDKGLATEPEKKSADGAEFAEENYFEENGLTTRGEGRVTYLGTEVYQKLNDETGIWDVISVDTKEVEVDFSVTEELLDDGTKLITGRFGFVDEVTETEYRGVSAKSGVVDKQTGLVYPVRTYGIAEPFVIEKDGEQRSILVGRDFLEREDGNVDVVISVVCPEDYDDLVFFLTGNYMEEEVDYSKPAEVVSIRDLEHGETDLVFLR